MPNRFFNNVIDLFSGSKAKASDLEAHFNLITTGFEIVQTEMDLKAGTVSPVFTGVPLAPTASQGDTSDQIATTAHVAARVALALDSPALTGIPTAPTPDAGSTSNQVATAAMVTAALAVAASNGYASSAWVSGTSYVAGVLVYSPMTLITYRRLTNGAGDIDPSLDEVNWFSLATPIPDLLFFNIGII